MLIFAKAAFNGQKPISISPIKNGNSWAAKLPDGTVVTYRVADDASGKTDSATATVEINNHAIKTLNNGKSAKFKFPGV